MNSIIDWFCTLKGNDVDLASISVRLLNKCLLAESADNFQTATQIIESGDVALSLRDLVRLKINEVFKKHVMFFDVI